MRERRRELTAPRLAGAAEVFAARGFHGASLDEIAETAGSTRGAIYKNFANKEELFFAVRDNDFNLTLQSFSQKLERDGGPLDVAGRGVAARGRRQRHRQGGIEHGVPALRHAQR